MVLPVTARGELASAVGIRKAGAAVPGGEGMGFILVYFCLGFLVRFSSGRVTAGIACGNKLKRDGWRVVLPLLF